MKTCKAATAAVLGLLALGQVHAQPPGAAPEDGVGAASVRDPAAHRQRLMEFSNLDPAQQEQALEQARTMLTEAETRSTELEDAFDENQLQIENMRGDMQEGLGALGELFGVLSQVAGQAGAQFRTSLTNIEHPDRVEFLTALEEKLAEGDQLPDIMEIERLWFELLREAAELGQIERWPDQQYVTADGQQVTGDVIRLGDFHVVADGAYLRHNVQSNTISELQRQPADRYIASTSALVGAQPGDGVVAVGVDPTRRVLGNLGGRATWLETIEFGGAPGYVIIALGILGVLLSIERFITLGIASRKVKGQLKRDTPSDDNALGRLMRVYEQNRNVDKETLELRLSEAILKETPRLQRGILFIQIISVVAPLLGLLGTVVGMIQTFESITLFGTGDPSIMAGGISQALVTTQFGLMVAIPTVLLHTIVSGQSRGIIQILQERSTGLVAAHAERTRAV